MSMQEAIAKQKAEQAEILVAADPERINARIKAEVSAFNLDKFGGFAPSEIMAAKEQAARIEYDNQLRARAEAYRVNDREIERGLRATAAVVSRLPDPRRVAASKGASQMEHDLRQMRLGQEFERVERMLAEKTPAQVEPLLKAADDEANAVLLVCLEAWEAGESSVTLRTDRRDASGDSRLRQAIKARQRARLEQHHPELVAAEQELAKLQTATMSMLVRHLVDDRRGVAYRGQINGVLTIEPGDPGVAVRQRTAAMI
jgi:hypothetical protein